jgi:hypothetical protein
VITPVEHGWLLSGDPPGEISGPRDRAALDGAPEGT